MNKNIKKLTKKQCEVLNAIEYHIKENGVSPTLEELRVKFGYKNSNSIRQYLDVLEKQGLIRRLSYKKRGIELTYSNSEINNNGLVVLPVIASAGCDAVNVYAEQQFDENITIDVSYIPKNKDLKSLVIFKAIGDSMNMAGINSGDYVLVQRTNNIDSGDRVVVSIGDMAVIKRIKYGKNAVVLEPESSNVRYEKIILKDNSKIFGKVLDIIKMTMDDELLYEEVEEDVSFDSNFDCF